MEWVTGIGIEGGQFVGNMLSSSIDDRNIHLGDLVTMGIPNDDTNRKMVTQEFSQWLRSSAPGSLRLQLRGSGGFAPPSRHLAAVVL